VLSIGFAGYPDVTLVCDRLERDPDDASTATNPTVVVEILSPSTEEYDRGEKLRQHRELTSLPSGTLARTLKPPLGSA
jgi:Uma2 family endonuclease